MTEPSGERRHFVDRSLVQLTLVRFREFVRAPEALFWTFVFPVLLAVGLGLAFSARGTDRPDVALVSSPATDALARSLRADTALAVRLVDDSSAARALRTGQVALVVRAPEPGAVEYAFDPSRNEAATARLLADRAVQSGAGRTDPVQVRERHITEPGSRYIDFVIPGLLGMNLMGSGIWAVGFAIVDSRSKRLLKRLMATPMSRAEFLLSFLLSRLAFLALEVITILGFGALVFAVPMRGSFAALGLICLLSALCFAALGLLVASRARTIEGASGLMNFVMLPMWIFSGVFFSASNFPALVQPLIQALPLTAVLDALRANMLEGASLPAVGGELLIVAVWMIASFGAALRLFRWR